MVTLIAVIVCLQTALGLQAVNSATSALEGTWVGESSKVGVGDHKRVFKPGELRLTFSGSHLETVGFVAKAVTEVKFTVDARKSPKHFDYIDTDGETKQCIYDVNGDTLTIAVPRSGGRPTSLADDPSLSTVILVLKRQR